MKKYAFTLVLLSTYMGSLNTGECSEVVTTSQQIYKAKESVRDFISPDHQKRYDYLKLEKETYYPPDNMNNGWESQCKKDKFEGYKSCYITKPYSDIFVYFREGKYSVLIGRNHYPNTQSAIKIDNNSTIYGFEGTSNTPLKVIEQLKNGKVAYTRYKEWPYEYNKDGEVDLQGFAKALEEMQNKYKEL